MDALERHRIARNMTLVGWPIYDDDDLLVGFVDEPEWTWDALTDDQRSFLRSEAERLQEGRTLSSDAAFSFMLGEYGIRCPHKWINREPVFRECSWCHLFEPLAGRMVQVGDEWRRMEEPLPPTLRIPVPLSPSLTPSEPTVWPEGPQVIEYRRVGSRYVPVT